MHLFNRSSKFTSPTVPRDEEDPAFVKSFTPDQTEEYKEFFNQFGFVVIRDVLTKEECADAVNDVWSYVESKDWMSPLAPQKSREVVIDRNDPSTWYTWPGMAEEGILGAAVVWRPVALKHRQNPHIYKVWSELLGRPDLMINHDRYGLFRPTKGVKFPGGVEDEPNWKTIRNLHLDVNPWTYVSKPTRKKCDKRLSRLNYTNTNDFIKENNEIGVLADGQINCQGLINFIDNREDDGGFILVPGFKNNFLEWVNETKDTLAKRYHKRQTFIVLPENNPIQRHALRITCRAGSMIVWDQTTAHGSAPNDNSNIRMAQFIKLAPAVPCDSTRGIARAAAVRKQIAQAGFEDQMTELGEKLFGLKPWA